MHCSGGSFSIAEEIKKGFLLRDLFKVLYSSAPGAEWSFTGVNLGAGEYGSGEFGHLRNETDDPLQLWVPMASAVLASMTITTGQ